LAKWAPYAQIAPVFDNVNFDYSFRTSWLNAGAPAEGLSDMDEMNAGRQKANEMAEMQQQAEVAESGSKAYLNVSKAPEEESIAAGMF